MSDNQEDLLSQMLGASEAETVTILIDLVALLARSGAVSLEDFEEQFTRTSNDIVERKAAIPTNKYKALLKFIAAMKEAQAAAKS